MTPKIKILSIAMLLLVAGALYKTHPADAASCGSGVLKFFPTSEISSVIGSVKSTSGSSSECSYELTTPPGGRVSATVEEYRSSSEAANYFNGQYSSWRTTSSKLNIGDESYFKGGKGIVKKGKFIFTIYWYCFCTEGKYLSQNQAETLLAYAASQIADDPSPPPGTITPGQKNLIECTDKTTKYFPPSKVESVIKKKIQYATITHKQTNSESCKFELEGTFTTYVYIAESASDAHGYYLARSAGGTKTIMVGDEAKLSATTGHARQGNFIFEISRCCGIFETLSEAQVVELLKYAVSQATSTEPQKPAIPTIKSVFPAAVFAGKKMGFSQDIGYVWYGNNFVENFKITGENLTGTKISFNGSSNQIGDPIYLIGMTVSADGRQVTGTLVTQDSLMHGKTIITLSNSAGAAKGELQVQITGDQYLNRNFRNTNVTFRGEWPEAAPNQEVQDIERAIARGLALVQLDTYKKIGIEYRVYQKNYWLDYAEKRNCQTQGKRAGCSATWDRVTHIATGVGTRGPEKITEIIVHESAHKLDSYYRRKFFGLGSRFYERWAAHTGDTRSCAYLPLRSEYLWKDGSYDTPRCGFAEPYGAISQAEDVATMTETLVLTPGKKSQGDWPRDNRYQLKENLLKEYGFIK